MLKFDNYRRLFYENDFICCNYRRFFPNGNNRKIPRNTSEICYTKESTNGQQKKLKH